MYAVAENRPGCEPDTEPVIIPDYGDAKSYALDVVLELVELRRAFDQKPIVVSDPDTDPNRWIVSSTDPFDVGRVVGVYDTSEDASWNDGDDDDPDEFPL